MPQRTLQKTLALTLFCAHALCVSVVAHGQVSHTQVAPEPALRMSIAQTEYAVRRDALITSMKDGILLVAGSARPDDTQSAFWQDNQLKYLTGCDEPDATLMLIKSRHGVATTLFVPDRDPAREVWSGRLLGPTATSELMGIPARSNREFPTIMDSVLSAEPLAVYLAGDRVHKERLSAQIEKLYPSTTFARGDGLINKLRARKSPTELELLRKAIELSTEAHRQALMRVAPFRGEYEVQALVEYVFRSQGGDGPSFPTIIASGPNSTILHYNTNSRVMNSGELVVMDIGASYAGYAGDVTRTLPVNGVFTPEQRAVYQAVRNAQAAAERQAVLGAPARRMADSAVATLAEELTKLGLIESPDATYACRQGRCPQYTLYFMHGIGHPIGLSVHDFGTGPGSSDVIAPGDAFTIEPGLYIRANTVEIIDDLPENQAFKEKLRPIVDRYRDIGVRIEDNYLATSDSVEWVSRVIREADDIESAMLDLQQHPLPAPQFPIPSPTPKTIPSSWRTSMQIALLLLPQQTYD